MARKTTFAFATIVCFLAAGAFADEEGKLKLSLTGAFGISSLDFSGTRSFTEFAEEGRVDADYSADKGPGFEGGLTYRFGSHLGVALTGSYLKRDSSVSLRAALPHPLYLNRDRLVEANLSGLSYKETAGHLDLVVSGHSGSIDFSAFAGPSIFKVDADLAGTPTYTHSYPFDSVTVTSVPSSSGNDTAFGFNAGAGVDYRFGPKFAFGVQGRFSRGSAKLPIDGGEIEVDAGGFAVGAGIRINF
jgi:opacity protein-like surface antigen